MTTKTNKRTSVEDAYLEYLKTPRTTDDFKNRFDSKENAVWQVLRTLRLRGLVVRSNGTWEIVDERPTSGVVLTQYQREVLEYLREPHRTSDVMEHFTKTYQSAIQVIRTLRLMGYVESVEICGATGGGGCWFVWQVTDRGQRELE